MPLTPAQPRLPPNSTTFSQALSAPIVLGTFKEEAPRVGGYFSEEIRQYIGADSLAYLSMDGLKEACGEGVKASYCTACYTGIYPTEFVDLADIKPAAPTPVETP